MVRIDFFSKKSLKEFVGKAITERAWDILPKANKGAINQAG